MLLDMQSMRQLSLTTLGHRCIRIPQRNDMQKVVDGFMGRWQFLQCAGALDITHIPAENHTDYFNRKGLHSVVMLALVDYWYWFMDIYIRWPGSVHDACILTNSDFLQREKKVPFCQIQGV